MKPTSELERFLAARLEGGSEWVGISSNAMVREALGGDRVKLMEYPHDHADLSRCCMTYARAPWSLKAIMLVRLASYFDYAMNGFRPCSPLTPPVRPESRILRWTERLVGWLR